MKSLPVLWTMILAACASSTPGAGNYAARFRSEPAVREATFRYLFANNASGMKGSAAAYYVRFQDSDADAAVLARFRNHSPPVRPASRCRVDPERGVIDRETGERGILFTIETIEWTSDDTAVVTARYYEGNLSSAGYRLVLERDGAGFAVVSCDMQWVSGAPSPPRGAGGRVA